MRRGARAVSNIWVPEIIFLIMVTKSLPCHQHFFCIRDTVSPSKLKTWMTNIQADTNSIQAIHKSRNNYEDVKKDHFFKETYTGWFKDPRTDRFSPSRANQSVHGFMVWSPILFSVLDHQTAEKIAPSGVLSITPNQDASVAHRHSTSQTMNLLNMNVKVLIYASS